MRLSFRKIRSSTLPRSLSVLSKVYKVRMPFRIATPWQDEAYLGDLKGTNFPTIRVRLYSKEAYGQSRRR